MYFPYFRGRQYELLALKELARQELISSSIIPVIEPVKLIPALRNSLLAFEQADLKIGMIMNPAVGDLTDEPKTTAQLLQMVQHSQSIIPSMLLNESTEAILSTLSPNHIDIDQSLVLFDQRDYADIYRRLFVENSPRFTLCPDERGIRRMVKEHKVLFENKFKKRPRNADYKDKEDEFFSEDHISYAEDGYIGFGDYSIVGDEYIESGFAPYAVAIHIVYFDVDNMLRIHHFVSRSNDDISDVAGKFYEAVTALYQWYMDGQERQLTVGLNTLLEHYKNRTYPGLPTLKKLSIMHHLELMGKYIDGRLDT